VKIVITGIPNTKTSDIYTLEAFSLLPVSRGSNAKGSGKSEHRQTISRFADQLGVLN
jgi:hypothetical protein